MARMNVCSQPGCPEVQTEKRCPIHRRQAEQARGSRQQRGYDAPYDRARADWKRRIDRGDEVDCHAPICLKPARRLLPGDDFDLGHDGARRIRGPEHATCNRSAGGRAAHGG